SSTAYEASVAIKGERIVAVGPHDMMPAANNYIDASGKYVLPGAIDCHVHLRPTPGDDWTVGTRAAALAGLTTIIPFGAYNAEDEESLPEAINRWKEEARSEALVDYAFHYILSNTPYIIDGLAEAISMGVTSFKMFMTYDHRVSDSFIASVMDIVGANGGIVQLHAENGDVIEHLMDKAIAEGRTKPTDFPATCPPWAEAEAINRGILMGAMTNCPMYIVHLTTQLGLERIKDAQRQGQRVWTETCPQYLLLDETAMERFGPFAKIGPPLRPADGVNQNALWDGTENGYISAIGSDHSPAPTAMKEQGWDNVFRAPNGDPIPFGAPSMETIVPLVFSEGVAKRGLPIWWMARLMAENPARIFGLYPRKGVIQPGSDADLLIIDPDAETTIQAQNHQSTTGFTPYEDWKVSGKPWMTLLRGKVLLNDGKLEQQPGSGEFIAAGGPIPPIAGKVR
ncbi:MAG: amidohydrolase family protein, partial [SAR202 cluster bacterium]|nr:amidohydrolase family protein [SAR202 cluster bacterium]